MDCGCRLGSEKKMLHRKDQRTKRAKKRLQLPKIRRRDINDGESYDKFTGKQQASPGSRLSLPSNLSSIHITREGGSCIILT